MGARSAAERRHQPRDREVGRGLPRQHTLGDRADNDHEGGVEREDAPPPMTADSAPPTVRPSEQADHDAADDSPNRASARLRSASEPRTARAAAARRRRRRAERPTSSAGKVGRERRGRAKTGASAICASTRRLRSMLSPSGTSVASPGEAGEREAGNQTDRAFGRAEIGHDERQHRLAK